jgi:hypothetical protein
VGVLFLNYLTLQRQKERMAKLEKENRDLRVQLEVAQLQERLNKGVGKPKPGRDALPRVRNQSPLTSSPPRTSILPPEERPGGERQITDAQQRVPTVLLMRRNFQPVTKPPSLPPHSRAGIPSLECRR